mgnify:CR=1 FL=1
MQADPRRVAVDYTAAIATCDTAEQAAAHYSDALYIYGPDGVEWGMVNKAILGRWSKSTLEKIKRAAWKHVASRRRGQHGT